MIWFSVSLSTTVKRRQKERGRVFFLSKASSSWDLAEMLKPTIEQKMVESVRGSQRKQVDFVSDQRQERSAITGRPLSVETEMSDEG